MAPVTFRIPSKIPYGYIEFVTEGELDAVALANQYVEFVKAYKDAEERALAAPTKTQSKHEVASVDKVLSEDEVVDLVVRELGGVPVDDDKDAPWNNKPEPVKKDYAVDDSSWDFG